METNYVKIETNQGTIIAELYPDAAPITVENFKKLVSEKFYDGITFHRVMNKFMIQAGDPTGTGYYGSDETIKGEFKLNGWNNPIKHERGVLSMARSSNSYNSASSQFFICHTTANVGHLDGSYAAFGKVIAGIETVDKIASVKTNSKDKPLEDQTIISITFVNVDK